MESQEKADNHNRHIISSEDAQNASLGFFYLVAFISTTIGILVVFMLNVVTPFSIFQNEVKHLIGTPGTVSQGLREHVLPRVVFIFSSSYVVLIFALHLLLKPLRDFLRLARRDITAPMSLYIRAKRRLINLPFLFIPVSVGLWIIIPLIIFLGAFITHQIPLRTSGIVFVRASMIGLVVSMIAYQRMETFSRKHLIPLFFPNGRLAEEKNVARISINKRIRILSRFGNAVPLVILFVTLITLQIEVEATGISAKDYGYGIMKFLLALSLYFFISTSILNKAVSRNISLPIEDMIRVLKKIRAGIFDDRVQVVSNDEIGYAGDVINEMSAGLADREKMRQSLNLAKEVQQNLLPGKAPDVEGFDIYGQSIYCDETGGDYFDFLVPLQKENGQVGIALGDVSGHGIASALLMTTARAFIRQRSVMSGSLSDIISDVNQLISRDISDTGSFITLFYMAVFSSGRRIKWVRAGHDPALLYDPAADKFTELKGRGIALGLNEEWKYEENEIQHLKTGQIILVSSDGIFEARNTGGEMFGRQNMYDSIRRHHHLNAREMVDILFKTLETFMNGHEIEDDLTLVVIKVE